MKSLNESLEGILKSNRTLTEAEDYTFPFKYSDEDYTPFEYSEYGDGIVEADKQFEDEGEFYTWRKPYSSVKCSDSQDNYQIWGAINNYSNEEYFFIVDINSQFIYSGPIDDLEAANDLFDDMPGSIKQDDTADDEEVESMPESFLQDIAADHEQVKKEFGQAVYNALDEYTLDLGNDLGNTLYSEDGWSKFEQWLKNEKGITLNYKNYGSYVTEALFDNGGDNYRWPTEQEVKDLEGKIIDNLQIGGDARDLKNATEDSYADYTDFAPEYDDCKIKFEVLYISYFCKLNKIDHSTLSEDDISYLTSEADSSLYDCDVLKDEETYANYIHNEVNTHDDMYQLGEAIEDEPVEQIEIIDEPVIADEESESNLGCVIATAANVMAAYQNANKWLDSTKEAVYTDLNCPFFSSYIHELAHSIPGRFDAFGDILLTINMKVPYPATPEIDHQPASIDDAFDVIFEVLDNIKASLNDFIKCTTDDYHGMAVAAENCLNDIESEYPTLYRYKGMWKNSNNDMISFDKFVMQHVEHKDDLLESLNELVENYDSTHLPEAASGIKKYTEIDNGKKKINDKFKSQNNTKIKFKAFGYKKISDIPVNNARPTPGHMFNGAYVPEYNDNGVAVIPKCWWGKQ